MKKKDFLIGISVALVGLLFFSWLVLDSSSEEFVATSLSQDSDTSTNSPELTDDCFENSAMAESSPSREKVAIKEVVVADYHDGKPLEKVALAVERPVILNQPTPPKFPAEHNGRVIGYVSINGRPGAHLKVQAISVGCSNPSETMTDQNGCYDLKGLWPGHAELRVSPKESTNGCQLGTRYIEVEPWQTLQADFVLYSRALRGRVVVDRSSTPIASLKVGFSQKLMQSYSFSKEGGYSSSTPSDSRQALVHATTNENGEFAFDPFPAGIWELKIENAAFVTPKLVMDLSTGEQKSGVEIRLQESSLRR